MKSHKDIIWEIMSRVSCILLLGLILVTSPRVVLAESTSAQLVKSGKEEFHRYCISCHGMDARGTGPASGALKASPADLTEIVKRRGGGEFPVEEISGKIDGRANLPAHGTREMPIWGRDFSEKLGDKSLGEEVATGKVTVLIEYLKSIQR